MAQFLFSGKNREGEAVTERIQAANVSAARYALETRGYREITFHTDDMTTAVRQTLGLQERADDNLLWTPAMELRARRGKTNLSRIVSPLKGLAIYWVPLLLGTVYTAMNRHWRWPFWVMVVLDVWFIKFYALLVLPGVAYHSLLHAAVWYRWDAMRRWVSVIRWLNRRGKSSVPEYELHFRLAAALAAEGKLEEALQLVSRFEHDPQVKRGSWFGRLAGLYITAKRFQEMSRCQKQATERGSGSAGEWIDYACGLVQRHKNVAEARQALEQAKEKEITDVAARYIHFCEGMIAIEEKDFAAAKKSLLEALRLAVPSSDQPLVQGWRNTVRAYLCIAVGSAGDKAEARELLRRVEPLLRVRHEDELLQRCRAAAI